MWINILIGAVSGVIAAIIANLFVSRLTTNKNLIQIVTVVIMIALFVTTKSALLPYINAQSELSSIEKNLSNNIALNALKEHEPEEFKKIIEGIKTSAKNGGTEQDFAAVTQTRIQEIVSKRLPIASNEAVHHYMQASVNEMIELMAKDPNLCRQLLFPEPGKFINLQEHISTKTLNEDLAGLAGVIRSSATTPTTPPTESEVLDDLTMVMREAYGVFGEDLMALENPSNTSISSDRLCQITIDVNSRILALPYERSGPVIRFLSIQK